MKKLEYCYHTHTSRCGHASGEDEQYVIEAIKCGIKRLGFSDHVMFPDLSQPGTRGNYSMMEDYLSSINYLKEKYKDQIDIIVGFEAEYLPKYLDYYKSLLASKKVSYLILGQHMCLDENGKPKWYYSIGEQGAINYANDVAKGIRSGLFTYVCHPDMFINFYSMWNETMIKAARIILEACEECHVPIEINICGMRRKEYYSLNKYPSDTFFLLAKEYKVDVVIGVDAHAPEHFNKEDIQRAIDFADRHKLHLKNLRIKKD